jgi:3-hydroxyanthranilate 3,4-dioxygenase
LIQIKVAELHGAHPAIRILSPADTEPFAMALNPPFNLDRWIDKFRDQLKPPVGNKLLYEEDGMIAQIIGGPNTRVDFHDDPVQEFFYQLKGDMILKVIDEGEIRDVRINEGEVFMLPPHPRHSPQRPMPGSIGLVVESPRMAGMLDAFEWYCFECMACIHRIEVPVNNIVDDLPPLYEAFYADEAARTCDSCGAVHPGKGKPPPGWADL